MHPMRNLEHKVPFLQEAEKCLLHSCKPVKTLRLININSASLSKDAAKLLQILTSYRNWVPLFEETVRFFGFVAHQYRKSSLKTHRHPRTSTFRRLSDAKTTPWLRRCDSQGVVPCTNFLFFGHCCLIFNGCLMLINWVLHKKRAASHSCETARECNIGGITE